MFDEGLEFAQFCQFNLGSKLNIIEQFAQPRIAERVPSLLHQVEQLLETVARDTTQ